VTPEPAAPLILCHGFAAAPEDVFDAWTTPAVLERWWAARSTWDSPGCDVDLRVGGRYVLRMRDDRTGDVHVVEGEFREIDRPRRLVYTWRWQGADGPDEGRESLVTVEFHAAGDGTTVVLEQSGLPSQAARERHAAGWSGTFDSLARRIFIPSGS
jgi:glutathione S-transferase